MDDRKELELWIRNIPIFRLLNPEEAKELATVLKSVHFDTNQPIFQAGDSGDALYIVKHGTVEIFVKDYSGEKIALRTAEPGAYFGELAVLNEGLRTASAVATSSCNCYVLNRRDLMDFLRKKPDAAIDMLAALSKQLHETDKLLRSRVSRNANTQISVELSLSQRIANYITAFCGSMAFLAINMAIFTIWILWNTGMIPNVNIFDPYPFGFLTVSVSLEAIALSTIVLLSQNLEAAKERIHSNIEYEVNLKAELEIAHLHEKFDRLQEEVMGSLRRIEK